MDRLFTNIPTLFVDLYLPRYLSTIGVTEVPTEENNCEDDSDLGKDAEEQEEEEEDEWELGVDTEG